MKVERTSQELNAEQKIYINEILDKKQVPIISPLGLGDDNHAYNINGDTAAGAIAKSLKSRRLLLMTNVEGVLDKNKKIMDGVGKIFGKTGEDLANIGKNLQAMMNPITAGFAILGFIIQQVVKNFKELVSDGT